MTSLTILFKVLGLFKFKPRAEVWKVVKAKPQGIYVCWYFKEFVVIAEAWVRLDFLFVEAAVRGCFQNVFN